MDYSFKVYKEEGLKMFDALWPHVPVWSRNRKQKRKSKRSLPYMTNIKHIHTESSNTKAQQSKPRYRGNRTIQTIKRENDERFYSHSKMKTNQQCISDTSYEVTLQKPEQTIFKNDNSVSKPNTSISIPVYLHRLNRQIQLINMRKGNFDYLTTEIARMESISRDTIMVLHYGKRVKSTTRIKHYDSLRVIVNGKGGMLDERVQITNESTEESIIEWIKQVLELKDEDIHLYPNFQFLDGQTLFAYETNCTFELKSHLKIPLGMARKILLFRDKSEDLNQLLLTEMSKWRVSDVEDFIKKSVTIKSHVVDELCRIVKEELIDGFVFLSYRNLEEMQKELFKGEDCGIVLKRIIAKRDSEIDKMINKDSLQVQSMSLSKSVDDIGETTNTYPVKGNGSSSEWISFLQNRLNLRIQDLKEDTDVKTCNLRIIHSSWEKRDILEKKFVFLILSVDEDFTNRDSASSLWRQIRKNLHTWQHHFSNVDKELFTVSNQKEDTLIHCGKQYSFSNNKVIMRYLMEKSLDEIICSEYSFLLISKNVLQKAVNGYAIELERTSKRKKLTSVVYFAFQPSQNYWTFDPDDFSHGFQFTEISQHFCGKLIEGDKNMDISLIDTHPDSASNNSDPNECLTDTVNVNSCVSKDSEFEQKEDTIQIQRSFKGDSVEVQYGEGWRISTPEHDGAVSFRCFEFTYVPDRLIDKGCSALSVFMNCETIRFACGCLNMRKNGTIMFGIGDSNANNFRHGEVVGVPIDKVKGDFRASFTDLLRQAIQNCFESHCSRIVSKCIGNPVFIKVISKSASCPKFVIEIDIEPSSAFCKDTFFKINRKCLSEGSQIEKEFTLYIREDTGTKKLSKQSEVSFIKNEFKDIVSKRIDEEKQMFPTSEIIPVETPMDKLRKRMCMGSNKLDKSIWPILILSKPTDDQKSNEHWMRCLKFIKSLDFLAVFDFDNESNTNGLCAAYRNKENSILQDEELFLEYSGNKLELATKLGIPHDMKTVWIFSNGRADIKPEKDSKLGNQWINTYSAGIRDAVIFYSQREIIPKGRALVLLLVFSYNIDGLLETLREVYVRFGLDQVVIIGTESTLARFYSESRDMYDNLSFCSITGKGMIWEHVNATFLEITGCEDQGNVFLPTSAGAFITADEKFVETLTEFNILSARQCETREFKSPEEREKFSSEVELHFYRGEKVEWFNFFFGTHVLKRHCFDRLKAAVGSILRDDGNVKDREKKIVSTVVIAHEPGAGGTTLSRNILWAFRKKYRCAIITKITERTSNNIMSLWQHKESTNGKPLLLLIDELQHSDLNFKDLLRQIHVDYRSNPVQNSLICCFLLCQRENEISGKLPRSPFENSGYVVEHLKQKLTENEIQWMDNKYKALEKKGAEYKPEYLLSFMILREGFRQEYIRNTIKQFLRHIDITSSEFELLEYTSLLSTYAPISKRGSNVFIPLECCDDLMNPTLQKSIFWEKSMSTTLKMFLIIEQKETSSGMQVRMAHPALAEPVLSQILENKNESLSSMTLRFLGCSILKSRSYGRDILIDFTKEMLVRRLKEEYNDERTTSFSPLIEDICKQEHSWMHAKDVLQRGFEKMKEHFIALTVARLCSRNKDFKNGIAWAQEAVAMSIGRTANGFCHHTLAIVLHDKFTSETKIVYNIRPNDATKYIDVILDAVNNFIEASRLRTGNADHILYPISGVLNAILDCLKFIKNKVKFTTNLDIMKFVTDETYLPTEIDDWLKFKPNFLMFSSEGEKALTIIEQCLCFNTTFYAHDGTSSRSPITKEHRLYRNFEYRYPYLFNDFSSFFGENNDEVPQSNVPEVLNDWHRRRLIHLSGNSYMNIFNILQQVRDRSKSFNRHDGIQKAIKIKSHITKITEKTPKDLTNLVSVNIVLGLLGGDKRDSTQKMLEYSKQILKMKREYEDVAYFFICLLLWPSCQPSIEYEDILFQESLRYLHRKKDVKHDRPRDMRNVYLKEEKNVTQPTTQFFLTNGRGFKSFCHRSDLFFKQGAESQFNYAFWEGFVDKYNLKRLKGYLKFYEGRPCIRISNEHSTVYPFIEIRKIRSGKKEFISEEEVYFYLGFSIAGPIAYNVKPTRYEDMVVVENNHLQIENKVEKYLDENEDALQHKLDYIQDLKSKQKHGRHIKERDKQLIQDEADIRAAIDMKRIDLYQTE